MNPTPDRQTRIHRAALLLVLVILAGPVPAIAQQDYVGAEYCANCHPLDPGEPDNYADWRTSGHRFMLQAAEDAQHRALPLPEGLSWDDISYVVGGHSHKAIYLDGTGHIVTGTVDRECQPVDGMNQYNLKTGTWSDFHPGEDKPYDCGRCHTTGYLATGSTAGMPGIVGSFAFPGVQCEVCHGPGSTMQVDQRAEACGTCHKHPDTDGIEAVNGFIRSEGQFSEFKAWPHTELACVSCHNPHKKAEFSIKQECANCHVELAEKYATSFKGEAGIQCEDCHMPYATLAAEPLGPNKGDRRSHIFYINTVATTDMFTEDGSEVKLDDNGKAAVTLNFVCQRCHQGKPLETLSSFAKNFHDKY
jgi:hypothetical protein